MCCIIGWPTIGSIGFGWLLVSGRRRAPWPPAITTAFMRGIISTGVRAGTTVSAERAPRPPVALLRTVPSIRGCQDGRAHVQGVGDGRHVVQDDPGRVEHPPRHPGDSMEREPEVAPRDQRDAEHEAKRGGLAHPPDVDPNLPAE